MNKNKELKIKLNKSNFDLFVSSLKEFSKIVEKEKIDDENDNFKVKIVKYEDKLYFYNLLTAGSGSIIAAKDLFIPNIFNFLDDYNWFISDPNDFLKYLDNLDGDEIEFHFYIFEQKGEWIISDIAIKDGISEIFKEGEKDEYIKMPPSQVIDFINDSILFYNLEFNETNLKKAKSYIKSEKNKNAISFEIVDKSVYLKGTKWKLKLSSDVDIDDIHFYINKKWILLLDKENNKINFMKNDSDDSLTYYGIIQNNSSRIVFYFESEID